MTRIALGAFAASLFVLAPPAAAQTLGVTVSPLELTIQEGSTGSYTVVLNAQPTATVTISVTASDSTSACRDSSGASCTRKSGVATVDKSSLTFTTTDWNSAQTVTVTATDEDMAGIFKFAQVTHDASGGGYDTVTVREVRVTVLDNDVRNIVYQIGSPGNLQENSAFGTYEGSTHSYYVSLKSEPTEATTVTFASEDASRVTVSPASLTFSPTNWNVAQPVPFSVADNDVLGEDRVQVRITQTFTGSDYDGWGVGGRWFTVTVFNNDVAPETVNEGDSIVHAFGFSQYRAYTIRAESVGGAATVAPASVQVTQANYERLPFTVTGVRAGRGKINFWIGDYLIRSFVVTVGPPAIPRRLTLSANRRAAEGGRDVTITARLDSPAPAGGTEVTLRVGPESTATRGVDYTLSRTAFTIAEGDRTGTAILRVIDDADDDDGETVYLFADSRNPELSSPGLRVDIRDNDVPSVTLSASPNPVPEGFPVTVTARVSTALSSDVTIPLTLTPGTADEDDYGSLSSIVIKAGSTSGSDTISTVEDEDTYYETFTVALGSLPSSLQAGDPSSVEVTIWDTTPTNEDPTVTAYCDPCRVVPGGEVRLTAEASDPDGDPLTCLWSAPAGRFMGAVDGFEAHWQAPTELGTVQIRIDVSDGLGGTDWAEVEVEVANEAPVFREPSYAFELRENEDGRVRPVALDAVEAEDPDGDEVTYSLAAGDGTRFAVGSQDGVVSYVGAGEDYETEPNRYRLTVRARDPHGAAATVGVTVEVTNVNEAPSAAADTAATNEDEPITVDVLANDADPDGDALRVESVSQPTHGAARLASGGGVVYAPEADWHGGDRFTYTAADDNGGRAEAEVVVRVAAVNDGPVAVGAIPNQALEEGGAAAVLDLGPYFEDVERDTLTYAAESSDPNVAAVTVAGAVLTVAPVGYGSATIEVTACDPDGLSAAHTFAVGANDRVARLALDEALAATARAHMASARMTLGRRVGSGRGDERSRLTVRGRSIPLDEAGVREAAERLLAGWTMSRYLRGGGLAEAGRTFERQATEWAAAAAEGRDDPPAGARDAADLLAALGVGGPGSVRAFGGGGGGTEFAFAWGGGDGGRPGWRLWGQGDIQTFAGDPAAERGYEGDLRTGWAGLDRALGENWLAGVAVAKSGGGSDWSAGTAGGRLETSLTAVHPYLRWSDGSTSVWATAGGGRGSAENVRATGRVGTSRLDLGLGLLEVRRRFADWFGLRADAAWARLATGTGIETVDGRSAMVEQQRLGIDVSRSKRLGGLALEAFGEASGRRDGGAGQTGTGLELAGGLRAARGAVRVDAQGRILVLHSARGYRERGLGLTLTVGGPSDEEGLSLSVSPRWGGSATRTGALWEERLLGIQPRAGTTPAAPWALDAQARWALRLPGGRLLGWSGSLDRSAAGWGLTISGGIAPAGPASDPDPYRRESASPRR